MTFRISGLSPQPFEHLFGLSDEELKTHTAIRYRADGSRELTDRIEMRNAEAGESVLLVNHECQTAKTPYRATHAIFVLEGASAQWVGRPGEVPQIMQIYLQSLRGFSEEGMLIEADVAMGADVSPAIERLFQNPEVSYIHAHNAKQGCYAGRIDRLT